MVAEMPLDTITAAAVTIGDEPSSRRALRRNRGPVAAKRRSVSPSRGMTIHVTRSDRVRDDGPTQTCGDQ